MQNTPEKDNMSFDPFGGELFSGFGKSNAQPGARWQSMNIENAPVRKHDTELVDLRAVRAAQEASPNEIEQIAAALEEAVQERASEAQQELLPEVSAEEVCLEAEETVPELSEDAYPEEIPAEEPISEEPIFEDVSYEQEAAELCEEVLPEETYEETAPEEPEMAEPIEAQEPVMEEPTAEEPVPEELFAEEAEEPAAELEEQSPEDVPEAAEPEVIFETEAAAEEYFSEEAVLEELSEESTFEEAVLECEETAEQLCGEEAPSLEEEFAPEAETEIVAAEAEETAEAVAEDVSEGELSESEETALALSGKTMTIEGQLIRAADAAAPSEEPAAPKAEKKSRRKAGFLFSPAFKKIGAAVALFALLVGSLAYYSSLIKYSGRPDPTAVAYLSMADHVRRTSADSQVMFVGEDEVRQLFLTGSSAERDLNLVVTDINGAQVSGTAFRFKVIDPDGNESFYTDEDMDGQLTIEDLEEGEYGIEMPDMEGFIMPGAIVVTVAGRIEYVKIENISEIIVDQDDINLEEEDLMAGGRQEEETPPPEATTPSNTDTVEYVETRTEKTEVEKTRTVTKFRGNIDSASGRIYYADGTLSNVVPVVDADGYLTGEHSIYAEKYTITVTAGEGGTASADASSSEAFKTVNITATPAEGYTFSGWSASSSAAEFDDATAASTTLLVPSENVTVTASFEKLQTEPAKYTLTIAAGEGGSASAGGSTSVTAKAGEQISITATPAGGYVFSGWALSGGSVVDAAGATTVFTMPAGNATVTANFSVDTTGGAMGGDVNLFAKDGAGKYIYDITAETVEEKYTETVTKMYGWQTIDGKTFYFDKNGNKVTGTQKIKGVSYIFGTDGSLAKSEAVLGIDVSTWQPSVDWAKVKASGVEYVIIRCGFRGYGSGKIVKDDCFDSHIRGAKAAGLKVGVYFFSQAINTTEAVEEASAVIEMVKGYSIDYPLVIDMEDAGSSSARTNGLTRSELTKIAIAFGETCRSSGYQAMIYANKYWLESKLDTSQLGNYYIWLAHYTGGSASSYKGRYEMWQYTSVGRVPGISGNVDMNYSYMG